MDRTTSNQAADKTPQAFHGPKIRVQYINGNCVEVTETQLAALRKVSGIERLIPRIETLAERPFEATSFCLREGGEK
jgi:hypothetical protein